MHFSFPQKVLFRHCDPAGIVFFPRYAEMVNDAVEAMFSERLGWPFQDIHPVGGVPTASIALQFKAPSRHGDRLSLDISLQRIGATSLTMETVARCRGEVRFVAEQTIVNVDGQGRPQSWPDTVRGTVERIMEERA